MASRTVAAQRRALQRAGLAEVAGLPACTTHVRVVAEVAHSQYGCPAGRMSKFTDGRQVTWAALADLAVCPQCSAEIAAAYGSDRMRLVVRLLEADDVVRAVLRFAADPGRSAAAGKATALARKLTAAKAEVAAVATQAADCPELAAACERLDGRTDEARSALNTAQRTGAQRGRVLERVTAELLPPRLHGRVTLDSGRVLAGVVGAFDAAKKVQEVVDVCTVARYRGAVLLDCPRFVVDYVNRFYALGSSWSGVVLTVPADGISAEQVQVVAALWDPTTDGPLADLATAVRAGDGVTG